MRLGEAGLRGDVIRIGPQRSPIERNGLLEFIRGEIHVSKLRKRHIVVRVRGDPSTQRFELRDNGRGGTALDGVLRALLRRRRGRLRIRRLTEYRAGHSEAISHEITHDNEKNRGDKRNDRNVNPRGKTARLVFRHDEAFGRSSKIILRG